MSIPLDHLYHHLENLCGEDVIIYRWTPHGSKNLKDLWPIKYLTHRHLLPDPILIAHDQEPLDYDYLENQPDPRENEFRWRKYELHNNLVNTIPKLRTRVSLWNVYDKVLLCHSEKNSPELPKFEKHFIGVYYWSHGLIARDWFRFAEHDYSLTTDPNDYTHDFLIYNRAWSGTREYRLKFVELLIENQLVDRTNVKFSAVDSDMHYTCHTFKNPKFQISNNSIEHEIAANTFDSHASADYVPEDYNTCGIEVVLETLFDDTRNHLTEKILRSIACGKPFILVSTLNSLQYLRDYGFKTFSGLIDESYDQIQDPAERLQCIVKEMHRISNLPPDAKLQLFQQLNEIAAYNKARFFSKELQQQITDEFKINVSRALGELKKQKSARVWSSLKNILFENSEMREIFLNVFGNDSMDYLESVAAEFKRS